MKLNKRILLIPSLLLVTAFTSCDGNANKEWTVTFDTDGGTSISDVKVKNGEKVTRPETDPIKTGYEFVEWFTTKEGSDVFDFDTTLIKKDTTIYAQYILEGSGGVKEITSDTTLTSGNFKSTSKDQNSVLVNGKNITANLSNLKIGKTGDCTNTDDSHFYGTNSALLAKGGSNVVLDKLNVTTDAKGANGVFAYGGKSSTKEGDTGDGTNITIKNSTINTSDDESGGVMVAGHGSLTAIDCSVTTEGDHSAPIRSDRGGDYMKIEGGTYTSSGKGSPAIYATATVDANNVNLKSNHSSGIVVEGSNDVNLNKCTLEDNNDELTGKSTTFKNIFLYQSTSGDSGTGEDSFTATDCTIITHNGDDIYVTNQTSTIALTNNTFTNDCTDTKYFLKAEAGPWGKSGENGGNVKLSFSNQKVTGDIYIDNYSTLNWTLTGGSTFTGQFGSKQSKAITIDAYPGCSITLTGDSYVTSNPDEETLACINTSENAHLYNGDTLIK